MPTSLASVIPALIRKKQEDDEVPFPREIVFARGADEPLEQWDMDTLSLTSSDIGMLSSVVFRAYGFFEAFRISGEKFAAFTTNVANYYRAGNPFHNFQHAFQVTLAMHTMLRAECRKFFSGVEIFAMLIAALCHDIDHPGNNNDFELKTLSPMALTHNDDAVLERHHCRVTFIILNHKSAKILQHLDEARYKRVRQLIIACILATDMAKHFDKCKALESLSRRQLNEKRQLLMGILIHAADLSHQTLPFAQCAEWGTRLLNEFQNQAKAEAEHSVATDFYMQNLELRKTRLIVQLNYINYVVRPIWLPLTSLCHHLRFYTDSLELNFDLYRQQLDEEDA
uniref:PDEase domain-containing protein n=1 Tax=Globisporangium ultimum (strain ATCC 200006 / CBS 805.95 / DAOM BR144) TaxID=431595 RepID=K3WGS5_GLOUD